MRHQPGVCAFFWLIGFYLDVPQRSAGVRISARVQHDVPWWEQW